MENTIFYSWQSDLPNNSNRGFLESCLKNVPKEVNNVGQFSIEFTIDRDTKNETGTPDITETIFKKIDKAKIFIADISIINSDSKGRKTPNPNVLIELGYAAKSIGWNKVLCIYNLDYGSLNDLPFDLRQRRPITYSLKDKDKSKIRKGITKIITESITQLHNSGSLFDIINDYLKVQVDTEILTIINHLSKIVFGYSNEKTLKSISNFMNLKDDEIIESLKSNTFLGFQIFKKWEVNENNLKEIADKTISSFYHGKELNGIIIELMRWTGSFDNFNRSRTTPDLFELTEIKTTDYKATSGLSINPKNTEFPDRFMLLKKVDESHGIVQDFGDFIEKDKIEGLINTYKFNTKHIKAYAIMIRQFIQIAEKWLDKTNGEFIIENTKQFEIKTVPNTVYN
jgi:hypothetical protein